MIDRRFYLFLCTNIIVFFSYNFSFGQTFIEGSSDNFFHKINSDVDRLLLPDAPDGCFQIEICGFDRGETYDLITGLTYSDQQLEIRDSRDVEWSTKGRHFEMIPESSCIHFTFCFEREEVRQFPFISYNKMSFQEAAPSSLSRYQGIIDSAGFSAEELIRDVLIGGNCFDVSNIQAIGPNPGRGRFFNGMTSIGIDEGIVFSTGNIRNILGPNTRPNTGSNLMGDGDPDLRQLVDDQAINDAVGIQFDFVPTADTVRFRYVFASEEYCEWVGDNFNDVFGFFISGPGIDGPFTNGAENIALIPGTTEAVAINNVNRELNSQYYFDNTPEGQPQGAGDEATCGDLLETDGVAIELIEFDGYTAVFEATAVVIPCETYTIKMVVGDVIDANYDSAVFLEAGSFDAGASSILESNVEGTGSNVIFDECLEDQAYFVLSRIGSGNLEDSVVVNFNFSTDLSTAVPGVDFVPLPNQIVIPPFQDSVLIPVEILDGFTGGPLRIVYELDFLCSCTNPFAEIILDFAPGLPRISAETLDFISCEDQTAGIQGVIEEPDLVTNTEWRDSNWDLIAVDELLVNVSQAGEYYFIGINEISGCADTVSVTVEIDQDLPEVNILEPDLLTCVVESVVLDGSDSESGSNISFQWQAEDGGSVIGVDDEIVVEAGSLGLYILTVTNEMNGCQNSMSVRVEGDFEEPVAEFNEPEELTCLINQSDIIANSPTPDADLEFDWSTTNGNIVSGLNSSEITVDAPGVYELELTLSRTGCSVSFSVEVEENVDLPNIFAGEDQLIPCDNPSVVLNAASSNHSDNFEINWTTSEGEILGDHEQAQIEVVAPGIYTVRIVNLDNGCEAEDFVTVGQNLPEGIDMEVVQPICPGDLGLLTVYSVEGGSFPYRYELQGTQADSISQNGVFSQLSPGDYNLLITDALGCTIERELTINEPSELIVSLPESYTLSFGQPYEMETQLNVSDSDISLIEWSPPTGLDCPNCLRPSVEITESTTYQLYVEDLRGCPAVAEIFIDVLSDPAVFIPNAFSPNDDGINDILIIYTNRSVARVIEWNIFDRWGEKVFSRENFLPNDDNYGWDGTVVNGEKAEYGVFVYVVSLELIDGEIIQLSGDVTILK
ncbi:MAG: hypothetical protein EA362_05465 [Saprospirales bacterium]|nr:MAG: hypothetical protein EA362_05465 [Saprospirales bacterium]